MKASRMRRVGVAAAIALVTGLLAAAPNAAWAAGTVYYVDAVAGSDSAVGTSPAAAWKTLDKVNATTFAPGDQILFHTDQSWSGQLRPKGSGASGNPITISNYGGGDLPHIDGADLDQGATVYLKNQSYWIVEKLEVTNFNPDNEPIMGLPRWGILAHNDGGGMVRGIVIRDNYVHHVNGCFDCDWGGNSHTNGGIVVGANISGPASWKTDSFDGVEIRDNRVDQVGRTGIHFEDVSSGFYLWVDPAAISKNITISGNVITKTDSDGITVRGARDVLIEHNVVGEAGQKTSMGQNQPSTAGIWPAKTINTLIQYNEVYGTKFNYTDGQGFDVDLSSTDTTLQYNYSHDNEGGFLLLMFSKPADIGENVTVRYNLSVNDGAVAKGVFAFSYGVKPNTNIYNNTIYVPEGSAANIMHCETCVDITSPWSFRNNIVANFGTGTYGYPPNNRVIDSNLFYGNHPASEPADANKITSDPQFVGVPATAPSGIGNVGGYAVLGTSPAVGSGALIAGNGGIDYFGDPVSPTLPPTRGFAEAQAF